MNDGPINSFLGRKTILAQWIFYILITGLVDGCGSRKKIPSPGFNIDKLSEE